jgi:2-methylisocitrate lyase-like PEP mutase family enzyme
MLETTQLLSFKQKLQQKRAILVPGAPNALAARVITDLGFEAIYVTGAGVTNMSLGLPDLAFVDLTQIVQHTMAIRNVTDLPLVVDADTGFGNAVNVAHTIRMLERAGASAVQIEESEDAEALRSFRRQGVGCAAGDGRKGQGGGRCPPIG